MSTKLTNRAAWQPAKNASAFEVKATPYTSAPANGIVIKNHAVAINPLDWLVQQKGDMMFGWLKYPFIFGLDVAGTVVEVGKNVSRFKAGDRVIGFACGTDEKINDPAEGGFQDYTVLRADLTTHIPNSFSYESACVIPLGLATAAAGLFQKDLLALQHPTVPPKLTGKTLIVWGGSTSVGCNAIQLGVAAGYEVFSTCSPRNFEYLKQLGASQVFDYKSKTVVPDMIQALKGKTVAGALSIGKDAAEACMDILDQSKGDKFVALATYPMPETEPKNLVMLRTAYGFVSWIAVYKFKGQIKGIKSAFIFGSTIAHNEVGKAVFVDFLPKALQAGAFVPAPEPLVVGNGLESIQKACETQRKGVSAKKVVVTL